MPTANDLLPSIGTEAKVSFESVVVDCQILDAKVSYGRTRVLVSPLLGSGSQWVEITRVRT